MGKLPKLPSELGPSPGRRRSGPAIPREEHLNHTTSGQREMGRGRRSTAPPSTGYGEPLPMDSRDNSMLRSKSPTRSKSPSRARSPPKSPIRSRSPPNSPTRSRSPPQSPTLGQYGRGLPRSKSPTRSGSPQRQKQRTAVEIMPIPEPQQETPRSHMVFESSGFDRNEPLRRSHSMKSPSLPISTITEEEDEVQEEEGGTTSLPSTPPIPHVKEFQRAHSYSGRGVKARTPIPLRPSPLLVSETANGLRTPSPLSSPVMKPSPLQVELRSNSSPSMLDSLNGSDTRMFSQGMGSQVMHVFVSSPTKEILYEEAKKYLEEDTVQDIKSKLQKVLCFLPTNGSCILHRLMARSARMHTSEVVDVNTCCHNSIHIVTTHYRPIRAWPRTYTHVYICLHVFLFGEEVFD